MSHKGYFHVSACDRLDINHFHDSDLRSRHELVVALWLQPKGYKGYQGYHKSEYYQGYQGYESLSLSLYIYIA